MPYLFGVLFLILLTAVLLLLMRRGWANRERRIVISDLPQLPPGPTAGVGPSRGIYVASTLAGLPYERVVAKGLGVKSAVDIFVRDDGVLLERQGANSLFIPRKDLKQIQTTGGMIGKFAAPGSIVVLQWFAAGTLLDTGVHIRDHAERQELINRLNNLLGSPNESRKS